MGRLLPFIIVVLLLIGLVTAVPLLLLQPEKHHAEITNYLSQKLHHSVVIGKMDARFFPPALQLHDVTVFETADSPLVQADEVVAVPDWTGLFHLKFLPSALTLDHPVFTIRRLPSGVWDTEDWFTQVSQLSQGEGWPLHSVSVHGGECHALDLATSQEISLTGVDGTLNQDQQTENFSGTTAGLATPVTFTFEGKGHFGKSAQWSGDLRFADEGRQWVVHLDDQGSRLDAKGQASQWRWDQFHSLIQFYCRWPSSSSTVNSTLMMQDWKTHFTLDSGSMTFYHSASMGGGSTEVKGDVLSGGGAPQTHVTAAFQDVPLSYFATGFDSLASMDGKVTGITRFQLVLSSSSWAGFEGQGFIEIKDGRYTFPRSSLKSLTRAHTMSYFKRKFPGFEDQGLPFTKFRTHWQAKNGFIIFDDALFDAGDVKAALAGRLDNIRHGIDSYIRLQIHEKSPALVKEISGHYLYGAPGHEQIQPIYGHLQGNWDDWSLRAATSSKIPGRVQSALRRSLASS